MTAPSARVALITGGASGIGAACALRAAKLGYAVAINFHTRNEEAQKVRNQCSALSPEVLLVQGDVTSDDDCRRIAGHIRETWGRLDILVNSAGTTRVVDGRDLDALSTSDFDAAFSVNCRGPFQMIRAARSMLEASKGSVVNVSSHAGISGYGSSLAYAASKGALNTLTLGLARSLAPAIRVNGVCPGFVHTDWLKRRVDPQTWLALQESMKAGTALNIAVEAQNVAECVFWLATSPAVTGHLLVVDAGTHLAIAAPLPQRS